MANVSPQLFPAHFSPEMTPTDIYSYDKTSSCFYIPDCQRESFEEFVKINKLAQLFFTDHFAYCLKPDGRINFEQVREWCSMEDLPSIDEGRIPADLFKNIHVISYSQLEKFKELGARCPWCSKSVKELTTCPLWETKLRYPDTDIDWSQEQLSAPIRVAIIRQRSNSDSRDFSLIHLIFLIDFAASFLEPKYEPPSDGIIEKFMTYDREYATAVLAAIRYELNASKTKAWLEHLQLQSDLVTLRSDLNEYLKECPTSNYQQPRAFTEYVLQNYPHVQTLEEVKESCEFHASSTAPIHRPVTPARPLAAHSTPQEANCMPLRYLLLSTIFICSFLYFFSTLLIAFFKNRFFFGDEL